MILLYFKISYDMKKIRQSSARQSNIHLLLFTVPYAISDKTIAATCFAIVNAVNVLFLACSPLLFITHPHAHLMPYRQ